MSLENNLKRLFEILDQEIAIYDHLYGIVEKEKALLIAAQIDQLQENNASKDSMIAKLHELEASRAERVKMLAFELGLSEIGIKLTDISAKLVESARHELLKRRDVLVASIERVSELNQANAILSESALNTITAAMGNIRDSLKSSPTYKREGALKPQSLASGQLVSREA